MILEREDKFIIPSDKAELKKGFDFMYSLTALEMVFTILCFKYHNSLQK